MMPILLDIRNESAQKRLYTRSGLTTLAGRICRGEGVKGNAEVSVMFCDDEFITDLNRRYRRKNAPTDVLSFEQDHAASKGLRVLGDIVISLETAERHCGGDRAMMRKEVNLLFCHGLLHLLGHDHATAKERMAMTELQAHYLGATTEAAWAFGPKAIPAHPNRRTARAGGHRGR